MAESERGRPKRNAQPVERYSPPKHSKRIPTTVTNEDLRALILSLREDSQAQSEVVDANFIAVNKRLDSSDNRIVDLEKCVASMDKEVRSASLSTDKVVSVTNVAQTPIRSTPIIVSRPSTSLQFGITGVGLGSTLQVHLGDSSALPGSSSVQQHGSSSIEGQVSGRYSLELGAATIQHGSSSIEGQVFR